MTKKVNFIIEIRLIGIGMGFLTLSLGLFVLGIIFFLDRSLLIMGNLAFLIGLVFLIGFKSTTSFFIKKGNIDYFMLKEKLKEVYYFSVDSLLSYFLELHLLDSLYKFGDYLQCLNHSYHFYMIVQQNSQL